MKNLLIFGGLLSVFAFAPLAPAIAHEGPCPFCSRDITQDTPTQDNEVALKVGRKRIEYKCVFCALAEAKTDYQGDLSIIAPSEKKGEPIVLKRSGGIWSALPATAQFVLVSPLNHKICHVQARAFSTPAAAQAFAKQNGGAVLDLTELNAKIK